MLTPSAIDTGDVVAASKEADVAVLRFFWRKVLPSVLICRPDELPDGKAWAALSVGCDGGRAPTCRAERVVDRKRIRKGGDGRSDGKAYFTHVAEVHSLLKRNDLEFLLERVEESPKPSER